jgi:hypothetical protein
MSSPSSDVVAYPIAQFLARPLSPLEHLSFRFSSYNIVPCLVPDDRVPCEVQELHGESSLCSRRPTGSWTRFLSCWRRPYRFFSSLIVFAATSFDSDSVSVSTEVGFLLSRRASVVSWQAVVPFRCALVSAMISFTLASVFLDWRRSGRRGNPPFL